MIGVYESDNYWNTQKRKTERKKNMIMWHRNSKACCQIRVPKLLHSCEAYSSLPTDITTSDDNHDIRV